MRKINTKNFAEMDRLETLLILSDGNIPLDTLKDSSMKSEEEIKMIDEFDKDKAEERLAYLKDNLIEEDVEEEFSEAITKETKEDNSNESETPAAAYTGENPVVEEKKEVVEEESSEVIAKETEDNYNKSESAFTEVGKTPVAAYTGENPVVEEKSSEDEEGSIIHRWAQRITGKDKKKKQQSKKSTLERKINAAINNPVGDYGYIKEEVYDPNKDSVLLTLNNVIHMPQFADKVPMVLQYIKALRDQLVNTKQTVNTKLQIASYNRILEYFAKQGVVLA